MNSRTLRRGLGASMLTIAALMGAPALAQGGGEALQAMEITTVRGASAPGADTSARVRNFLRGQGSDDETLATLELVADYEGRFGRRHQKYEQRFDGKRVVGSLVKSASAADGSLITVSSRLARKGVVAPASISADEALAAAITASFDGQTTAPGQLRKEGNTSFYDQTAFFHAEPTVEDVVVARRNGSLQSGYLVTTWSEDSNDLFETVIDGRGRVVSVENRTANDSYNVFEIHPDVSVQQIVQGPTSTTASPDGWLGTSTQYTTLISGNNARAYLDRDNNNGPDAASQVVSDGNFLTTAALNQAPTTASNQEVAVQNLFYLNNVIHDALYGYGFTEATLNFQENNFGRGGLGSDSVDAEAQDGGGTNNANFATPSDGSNPRMQMYLWNTTPNGLDGDLDGDIVWHEYGHGLTWRMIGSMSGAFPGAIGEGMSDALAIIMTNDDRVGEYATTNTNQGIRRYRYEGYPLTFADFTGWSVHSDGEIYAATLWDLKKRYEAAGYDRDVLMADLVDGMNFTAPAPDFLDMRDGILDAVPTVRDCLVWEAFSQFGMGESASYRRRFIWYTMTEDFTPPSSCS